MAAVQMFLLMRSGDVETNPGPGRFDGMFAWVKCSGAMHILNIYTSEISDLDYDNVDSNTILSEFL